MIEPPRLLDPVPAPAPDMALVRLQCTREELHTCMGRATRALLDGVAAQGLRVAGPLFAHHRVRPTDRFDMDIGVPVDGPVAPRGDVQSGRWPALRAACTVHRGRYEDLPAAWRELHRWLDRQGLRPAPDAWERYVKGPETGSDTRAWCTELIQPLLPG